MPGRIRRQTKQECELQAREHWGRATQAVANAKQKVKRELAASLTSVGTLFDVIDIDGSGTLSPEEFYRAVLALGVDVPPQITDLVFAEFDVNGSGCVNYTEFLRLMLRDALAGSASRVIDTFRKWDADQSGDIDKGELYAPNSLCSNHALGQH
jgi:hypothetical protein